MAGPPERVLKSWVQCCVPIALWVQTQEDPTQEDPWGMMSRQDRHIVTLQVP